MGKKTDQNLQIKTDNSGQKWLNTSSLWFHPDNLKKKMSIETSKFRGRLRGGYEDDPHLVRPALHLHHTCTTCIMHATKFAHPRGIEVRNSDGFFFSWSFFLFSPSVTTRSKQFDTDCAFDFANQDKPFFPATDLLSIIYSFHVFQEDQMEVVAVPREAFAPDPSETPNIVQLPRFRQRKLARERQTIKKKNKLKR